MVSYDYLYDKDFFGDALYRNFFSRREIHFKIFKNATILPHKELPETEGFGGLVDSDNKFVERSSIHIGVGGAYTPTENVAQSPASVIYLGMLMQIWGHCLTDNVKRLWFLQSDAYRHYFKDYPVVYTPMWGG